MMESTAFAGVWLGLLALVCLLAVAWLLVPLMLFGTKPLLRRLLYEQQRTNQLLEALRESARAPPKA